MVITVEDEQELRVLIQARAAGLAHQGYGLGKPAVLETIARLEALAHALPDVTEAAAADVKGMVKQ